MNDDQFHEQADELARDIEQTIKENKRKIATLPEFEPRSNRKRAFQQTAHLGNDGK